MKTRRNHRDNMMIKFQKIRDELLKMLDMNQEQYNNMIFDSAYGYLDYALNDPWAKAKLTGYSKFWAWWKNEYFIHDEVILNEIKDNEFIDKKAVDSLRRYYYSRKASNHVRMEKFLYGYLYEQRRKEFETQKTLKQQSA